MLLNYCKKTQEHEYSSCLSKSIPYINFQYDDARDTSGFFSDVETGLSNACHQEWPRQCSFAEDPRGKIKHKYNGTRIPYCRNKGTATFQIIRDVGIILLRSGDIPLNPGPVKNPCSVCRKAVAKNHKALLCNICRQKFHTGIKCGKVNMKDYEDLQRKGNYIWECPVCHTWKECKSYLAILPFYGCELLSDMFDQKFGEGLNGQNESDSQNGTSTFENLTDRRTRDKREILICHLNVNSLQNKIEELTLLNLSLKAQVVILTENKIDGTYSNKQFASDSYDIHREDRKKGGGGILMYVVKGLCSKKVKPPKKYTTIEVLAVQTKIDGENVLMVGIYRPPKISAKNYYGQLENELNELLTWASMQCGNINVGGDLNLDR